MLNNFPEHHWGFPSLGDPQNGWFIMGNPIYKWMISIGYPYDSGNTQDSLHLGVQSMLSRKYIFLLWVNPGPPT